MSRPHRIDELSIDLLFDQPGMPAVHPDKTRVLVLERLLPLMEQVLDEVGGGDTLWRIDRLEIDVGAVTEAQLPQVLAQRLRETLLGLQQQALSGAGRGEGAQELAAGTAREGMRHPTSVTALTTPHADLTLLLEFLGKGVLGWQLDAAASDTHEVLLMRVLRQDAAALRIALHDSSARAVMLTRLARQFGSPVLQEMLQGFMGEQARTVQAHLGGLRRRLEQQGVLRAHVEAAMQQAWEAALGIALSSGELVLSDQRQAPWRQAIVHAAVQSLARDSGRTVPAMAGILLVAPAGAPALAVQDTVAVHAAGEIREAAAAADADGVVRSLQVLARGSDPGRPAATSARPDEQALRQSPGLPGADGEATRPSPAGPILADAGHGAAAAMPQQIAAALMQGRAGVLYAQWPALLSQHAPLLRSALLHYGAYPEVRTRMAAGWPLSLLADVLLLCTPEFGHLTRLAWNDPGWQDRIEAALPGRAQEWRRHWWRAVFAWAMAQPASAGAGTAMSEAVLSGLSHAVATEMGMDEAAGWLEQAIRTLAGSEVGMTIGTVGPAQQHEHATPVSAAAPTGQGAVVPVLQPPTMPATDVQATPVMSPDRLSAEEPWHHGAASLAQLQGWVGHMVAEPSFLRAIHQHAGSARVVEEYYRRVLTALARRQVVDLEQCAQEDEPMPPAQAAPLLPSSARQGGPAPDEVRSRDASGQPERQLPGEGLAPVPVLPSARRGELALGNVEGMPPAMTDAVATRQLRDRLATRLAQALLRADPAILAGDWASLSLHHPDLLASALLDYGARESLLSAIVARFPDRLLRDMAVVLWPGMDAAWQALDEALEAALYRDEDAEGAAGRGESAAQAQASLSAAALRQWRKRLWQRVLQQGISSRRAADGRGPDIQSLPPAGDTARQMSPAEASATPATWEATVDVMQADAGLTGQDWQRQLLREWRDMKQGGSVAPVTAMTATTPVTTATTVTSLTPGQPPAHTLADEGADPLVQVVTAILAHPLVAALKDSIEAAPGQRPAPQPDVVHAALRDWPAEAAAALRAQFERMPSAAPGAWPALTAQQSWQLIAAHVLAYGDDPGRSAQRQAFLQAILAHAPVLDAPARRRYFAGVLSCMIAQRPVDLEALAGADSWSPPDEQAGPAGQGEAIAVGAAAAGHVPPSAAGQGRISAVDGGAAAASGSPMSSQEFISWLGGAAFANQMQAPPGLVDWFAGAVAQPEPTMALALALAVRNPDAVARLLGWLPHRLVVATARLSPHAPAQREQLLRLSEDIADLFGQETQEVKASALRRAQWRFVLPWLFDRSRIIEPARLAAAMLPFLARETGATPSAALWTRLEAQLGIPPASANGTATAQALAATPAPVHGGASASAASAASATQADAQLLLNGIQVANAGMVLAWPFLTRAWDALGLTHEQRFIDEQAAQRAAWLLQFLVFGRIAVPEYQLTLNKLLCGIALQVPIVASIEVTEDETALISQMLEAMIAHWKSLGNTSIEGLRQTFLQRQGYLSRKEDGWHLHVPKATFDMLLDKLPWSISTVRLPWMETILWVDWT